MVYGFVRGAAPSEPSTERTGKPEPDRRRRGPGSELGRRAIVAGRTAVAILVGLASVVVPGRAAFAFCRTTTCAVANPPASCTRDLDTGCWQAGIPLQWTQQCLSYAVNTAGSPRLGLDYSGAAAIVDSGFNHWPTASCSDGGSPSVAFMGLTGLTCDRVEYNPTGPNANAILFRDDNWTHDPAAIALTTVAFSVRTGQIFDADMEINTPLITSADLEFVVTHESGHFVGLDHSPDPTAVMYFQYNGLATQLSSDDIDAICTAYPTARQTPACDFEPPKGYATDCGGDVIAACSIAADPPSPEVASSPRATSFGWADGLAMGAAVATAAIRRRRRR